MIRAVIFDCFGVLTYDGWLPFKRKHFGDNPELERQATDLSRQLNAGMLDYGEFVAHIAELAGVSIHETADAIHDNVPNEELFAYIGGVLKQKYKIGLLSNTGRDMLEEIFTREQLSLFNSFGLSYEMGALKPDARAYHIVAERLEVTPEECVFIDDQERHLAGARNVGMHTIMYKDFEQFKGDLEALLFRRS